jgi:hypothetical protein
MAQSVALLSGLSLGMLEHILCVKHALLWYILNKIQERRDILKQQHEVACLFLFLNQILTQDNVS